MKPMSRNKLLNKAVLLLFLYIGATTCQECPQQQNLTATVEPKIFDSPIYLSAYDNSRNCTVYIYSTSGQPIHISIPFMPTTNSSTCQYNYLSLNGVRYCASSPIAVIMRTTPVQIVFHTDATVTSTSYSLTFRLVQDDSTCRTQYLTAGHLTEFLESSDVSNYRNGSQCFIWHISTQFGTGTVSLQLRTFNLGSYTCSNSPSSNVTIYDGPSTTSGQVAALCGYRPSDSYQSSSSILTLVYRTFNTSFGSFRFIYSSQGDYNTTAETSCLVHNLTIASNTLWELSSDEVFSSPTGSLCLEWHIFTKNGFGTLIFNTKSFNVGNKYFCSNTSRSYVAFYDGPSTTSPLKCIMCGYLFNEYCTSSSSSMTVVYRTSDIDNNDFTFDYYSVDDFVPSTVPAPVCHVRFLTAGPSVNYLQSSDVSSMFLQTLCYEWTISTKTGSGNVYLDLSSFNVGTSASCSTYPRSYVAIYDGPDTTSQQTAILCGYKLSSYYKSNSSSMTVVYQTYHPTSDNFTFIYSSVDFYNSITVPAPVCHVQYLTAESTFKYLRFHDNSSSLPRSLCYEWHISTKYGSGNVYLDFTSFKVGVSSFCSTSSTSYVAIYDGPYTTSLQKAILCGYEPSNNYTSNFSNMTIVYRTSNPTSDNFTFIYSSVDDYDPNAAKCSVQHLTADVSDKYIQYKDVPSSTTGSLCFEWEISTQYNGKVTLDLSTFKVGSSPPLLCSTSSSSYVVIYNGSSATNPSPITVLCGAKITGHYTSTSPSMTLVYRTSKPSGDYFSFKYNSRGDYSNSYHSNTLGTGGIVGIVLGGIFSFLILTAFLMVVVIKLRRKRTIPNNGGTINTNPTREAISAPGASIIGVENPLYKLGSTN